MGEAALDLTSLETAFGEAREEKEPVSKAREKLAGLLSRERRIDLAKAVSKDEMSSDTKLQIFALGITEINRALLNVLKK